MDEAIAKALALDESSTARDHTIDITTTGRRSGEARRIETWFYRVEDTVYLTGLPGKRDWAANLEAEPAFTFHLKNGVEADLAARAAAIADAAERREIFTELIANLGRISSTERNLDEWVAGSPLFAVQFD